MKTINFVLLIAAMSVTSFSFSQNSTPFEYHHFLVDGEHHYQVIADVSSTYGFYSKDNGGHLLRVVEANGKENTFKDFEEFPAMIVCLDKERRDDIYGYVQHTGNPPFHFRNYRLHTFGQEIKLQWQLGELSGHDLYMEIQRRDESGHFKTVNTMEARKGQQDYFYKEPQTNAGYRIVVRSKSNGAYYASRELIAGPDRWQLFPVPTTGHLQIKNIPGTSSYAIFDAKGKLFKSGKLRKYNDEVDLTGVPAGTYVIQFSAGNRELVRKFVKK